MTNSKKIYGRFIIEFFEDGIIGGKSAIGIKDNSFLNKDTPKQIKQIVEMALNELHKNYAMILIARSDEMNGRKQ